MDTNMVVEVLQGMVEDPAWEPSEDYPEFEGAYTKTCTEAGLPGTGLVLYLPAVNGRYILTVQQG